MTATRVVLADYPGAFSQDGEDAIAIRALERIEALGVPLNGWAVDVGCADGISSSNTARLVGEYGYRAMMLDADPAQAGLALANFEDSDGRVVGGAHMVGVGPSDNVAALAARYGCPLDPDFMSIDIDGMDYWVWRHCGMSPKLVCVEFNHTIPTEVRYVQPRDPSVVHGSSLLSLVDLGRELGYELFAVTKWNAMFVRREWFPHLWVMDNSPWALRKDTHAVAYVFHCMDGTVLLHGNAGSPWHPSFDLRNAVGQAIEPCWPPRGVCS